MSVGARRHHKRLFGSIARSASWSAGGAAASGLWARGRRCWSHDSRRTVGHSTLSKQFTDRRRMRILALVDTAHAECLALMPAPRSRHPARPRLEHFLVTSRKPKTTVSDNGTEPERDPAVG